MTSPFIFLQSDWLIGISLNFVLVFFARRIPLLTKAGWLHAGILGSILWGSLGWKGWLSVVIYFVLGSLVTKIGFAYKQSKGIAESRGGRRGPENVWGSAGTGAILAILYQLLNGVGENIIFVCFAASFAAKLSDTFGSEIGKRWGKRAVLITSFKAVPVGTDGAISLEGTIASLFGSLFMTIGMLSLSFISSVPSFFIVLISGFIATIFESLIGALAQHKLNFLTNELINFLQTSFASLIALAFSILLIS